MEQKGNVQNSENQYPGELEHLAWISDKIMVSLRQSDETVAANHKAYRDLQQYMMDYRHEIDPQEMYQNELNMREMENTGGLALQTNEKYRKLADSPYFARIDFLRNGKETQFYIGRFAFMEKTKILIFDWRAPVSSMFYDYELGAAGYDAPAGRIEGELTRKRQFKIKSGEMEYVFDTSMNIQDDILQRELSQTSDERMKTIIATIQAEQNKIIRSNQAKSLIIQGTAGSGKTTIALHRIAYLLYRYRDSLKANDVVILSPNQVFGDYISNVLPELGEEPAVGMDFAELADRILDRKISFIPAPDPFETDSLQEARIRFKSDGSFLEQADCFFEYASQEYFQPVQLSFHGYDVEMNWIAERYKAYSNHPIQKRLLELSEDILDRLGTSNLFGNKLPKRPAILRGLKAMFRFKDTLSIYREFFRWMNQPEMLVMPERNVLEWADVYPYLYFQAKFEGIEYGERVRHLVIDEMQDYTPIQYAVIRILFPCPKTVLGDFCQMANPYAGGSPEQLCDFLGSADVARLNKSYRSTYEIMMLAGSVLPEAQLEPMTRHGETTKLFSFPSKEKMLTGVERAIEEFRKGNNATLGIITKTNRQAAELFDLLADSDDIHLLTMDSGSFHSGISISSVQMSKGLEFDEVILAGCGREAYKTEYDRKLLYIAITRAMHKLTLFSGGNPSVFLQEGDYLTLSRE